jgi:hypothetical protein
VTATKKRSFYMSTITIKVDDESITTEKQKLTANEILTLAHIDAATHYLVRLTGRAQHSYQGKGNEEIEVHNGETFISVSTGPTPLS